MKGLSIRSLPFDVMSPIVGWGEFMKIDLRLTPLREFSRVVRLFLPVAAAILFFSFAPSAQTVDEVIAKNIQRQRRADKPTPVRSLRTHAKASQRPFSSR